VRNKDALLDEIVTIYLDALLPRLETTATAPGLGAERLAEMVATTIEVPHAEQRLEPDPPVAGTRRTSWPHPPSDSAVVAGAARRHA
jgi:hypothetical protein